jgi:hypothetical protein
MADWVRGVNRIRDLSSMGTGIRLLDPFPGLSAYVAAHGA